MLTPERAAILAAYAADRRGWDKAGCMAQLKKVSHIDADRVAMAWVRFCADRTAGTPGAFPSLGGPHWIERVKQGADAVPGPPKAAEACDVCGRHERSCICPDDERPQRNGGVWRPSQPASKEAIHDHAEAARALLRQPKEEA